jgi:hypothetical protein
VQLTADHAKVSQALRALAAAAAAKDESYAVNAHALQVACDTDAF